MQNINLIFKFPDESNFLKGKAKKYISLHASS